MTNVTADVVVVDRDDSVVGSGSVSPLASLLDVAEIGEYIYPILTSDLIKQSLFFLQQEIGNVS